MSAETKWTPGPWRIVPAEKAQSPWIVGDFDGGSIADCEPPGPWISPRVATANAHLIAAAPELYEALKTLIEASDGGTVYEFDRAHDIAHEALSRARGGS